MKHLLLAAGLVVTALSGLVQAQDKPKADPTGTWKWKVTFNDQSRDMTLKLKLEGDKLTGHMLGRNDQEIKIEEATFKDNAVAFAVTQERNGQKSTTKYKGKLDGDTIKGETERERGGEVRKTEWEAKREKTEKK
ncbi:MAG TPA: hypothetical protein VM165_10085 [Planctomycetaceae bacterium]|nr:hypothetical protein [Planctomycetaceae bacterium]